MKRSRFIVAGVLSAVVVLIGWISQRIYWEDVSVSAPLRGEARVNPFYSAQRLVEELGGRSERRRSLETPPPTDAVIVLTHWHWSVIDARREQLERWVEAGGRLVMNGALLGGEEQFAAWIGVSREGRRPDEPTTDDEGEHGGLAAAEADLCRELKVSHGGSPLKPLGDVYTICEAGTGSWLASAAEPLWALHDGREFQAVRVAAGRGSVTLLNANPFGNRDLLKLDHARLLADVAQLRGGDFVVFISQEERATLLELIWRYGAPVVVLAFAAVGAGLWRASLRFGPMEDAPELSRRSLAEQIRGTGQFVMRAGRGRALHAAMVRALDEAARQRIPGYARLRGAERIDAVGRLTGVDVEQLAAIVNYSGPRRAHDLRQDVGLLQTARERLLNRELSGARHAD